jgi:eukaryotic-like serine/threonine-protein kinase
MSSSLFPDARLDRYEIRSKLGAGGMGEVYLALDTKLDRRVALKILPADVASNPDRMDRFVREAKSAAALSHPNIAQIFEIGEDRGTHFIAMEFIEGVTLRAKIYSREVKLGKLLRYLQHVAEGLAKAHAAGIVHRDLKPDNIMITREGHAKILDFGLAKLIEPQQPTGINSDSASEDATAIFPQQSKSGLIMGTVGYMSPEQALGKTAEIDQRSDIFSFGCILYEAVTGRKAFAGTDVIDSLNKIIREPIAPVSDFRPDAPQTLDRIVRHCLAKDPEDRYQTIKDVVIDLKELRRELESGTAIDTKFKPLASGETARSTARDSSRPTTEATTSYSATQPSTLSSSLVHGLSRHKLGMAIALVVLIGAVAFFAYYLRASKSEAMIDSIAVLPFENKSSDADPEYLSDGLAESLIFRLSQLPNLKVSPPSSVFRYKGQETDPIRIGKELGVNAVMSGRMVQRGEYLSISIELIDVRNNKLVWGEKYEGKVSELLSTQREMATDITQKLQLKLSGEVESDLTKSYTENNEAYQLYLKGRFYWNKRNEPDLRKGIDYFREAVELDPKFAFAWSGLADSYALLPHYSEATNPEVKATIKAAAAKALELDPNLAEAHNSQAVFLATYEWNFPEAEKEFRQAIKLNPNYATAHHWLSIILSWQLRHDEAVEEMKRALEIEPLSRIINNDFGNTFLYQRQIDRAIEQFNKTLELYPDFVQGHHSLALALTKAGKYQEAIAEEHKAIALGGRLFGFVSQLSYINAVSGNKVEAKKLLAELLERKKKGSVGNFDLAIVYAGLGQKDQAFEFLTKSEQEKFVRILSIRSSPYFENLRDDPRFKQMLERIGLPE